MFQNFLNRPVKILTQLDMCGFKRAGILSLFWKSDSVWEVKYYKPLNLFINIDFHFKPTCWGYDWTEGSTSCMIHEKSTYHQRTEQSGTVHVEIGETCKKSKYFIWFAWILSLKKHYKRKSSWNYVFMMAKWQPHDFCDSIWGSTHNISVSWSLCTKFLQA